MMEKRQARDKIWETFWVFSFGSQNTVALPLTPYGSCHERDNTQENPKAGNESAVGALVDCEDSVAPYLTS